MMKSTIKTLKTLWYDDSGAAAAEYALILAIVGGAIAVASLNLGTAVGNSIQGAATCITNPSAANC